MESTDKKAIYIEDGQTNHNSVDDMGEISCTQCCSAFCTPLGIWVTFGFFYWVLTALLGYFEQDMNSDLFVWTVASALVAVMLQFCVLAVVIAGWTAHNPLVSGISLSDFCCFSCGYCGKLPSSLLAVFPYTCWVVTDICVHFAVNVQNTHFTMYSIILLCGHMISLFFITFIYYYFDRRAERVFRGLNFSFEWFDLASQIAVVLVYKANSDASKTQYYVNILWAFIFIQIVFWVLPITLGAGYNKSRICKHVWFIDVVTDIPILIIILASGAYKVQFWILIDILVKVILLARGCILNFCVFWLLPKLQTKRTQDV